MQQSAYPLYTHIQDLSSPFLRVNCGGASRNRTGVRGFAIHYLTTRPSHRLHTAPQLCNPWCIVGDIWGFIGASHGNPAGCQVVFLWENSRMGGKSADSGALVIHPTLCFFEPFFNMGIHGFLWVFMGVFFRTFRTHK